mgnify:CR=1 FL=1
MERFSWQIVRRDPNLDLGSNYSKYPVVTKLRLFHRDLTRGIQIETLANSFQLTPQNFDLFGFETVLVLRSFNLDNKGVFKTDSNGLKLENRILNHIDGELPEETGHTVEANYYPVTAAIVLEDLTSNRTLR